MSTFNYNLPQSTEAAPEQQPRGAKPLYFTTAWHSQNGFLSKLYRSSFVGRDGNRYLFAEQYVLHQKALFFNDTRLASSILSCKSVNELFNFTSRLPSTFDADTWARHEVDIVRDSILLKFTRSEVTINGRTLRELLIGTEEREIVYCVGGGEKRNRYWSIGFSSKDADQNREFWAENKLGALLMEVRDGLMAEDENEEDIAHEEDYKS